MQTNSSSRLQRSLAAQKGRGLAWLSLVVAVALTLGLWRYSVEDFADRAEDRFLVLAERQRGLMVLFVVLVVFDEPGDGLSDHREEKQRHQREGEAIFVKELLEGTARLDREARWCF